jgi:hypothetical protein
MQMTMIGVPIFKILFLALRSAQGEGQPEMFCVTAYHHEVERLSSCRSIHFLIVDVVTELRETAARSRVFFGRTNVRVRD